MTSVLVFGYEMMCDMCYIVTIIITQIIEKIQAYHFICCNFIHHMYVNNYFEQ